MKITEDDVGKRYRRRDGSVVILESFFYGGNGGLKLDPTAKLDGRTYLTDGTYDRVESIYDLVECLDDEEHLLCACGCGLDREVAIDFDSGSGHFEKHLENNGLRIRAITADELLDKIFPSDEKNV
jgi:hypothetical protein